VTFGDPSAGVSHSVANVAGIAIGKVGHSILLFSELCLQKESFLDIHMSVLGIFQSPQRPIVHPLRDGMAKNRQYWTSTVIPSSLPSMFLQSTAPLTAISKIQAFQATAQGPVTGLQLYYRRRCPAILGELTVISATQALEPGEDVQGLAISCLPDISGHQIYCIEVFVGGRSIIFGHHYPQCFQVREQRKVSYTTCQIGLKI
jgi:hypothetical protein